jgi:response regulator of citrate/malate metabolism
MDDLSEKISSYEKDKKKLQEEQLYKIKKLREIIEKKKNQLGKNAPANKVINAGVNKKILELLTSNVNMTNITLGDLSEKVRD